MTVDSWDSADIGDVAQEVQRSGFPNAYDKHVARARLLASALTGQTHAAWSCIVQDPAAADPQTLLSNLTLAYGSATDALVTAAATNADGQTTPAQMSVTTVNEDIAWSVAAFAVSWASYTGVTEVSVGSHHWQASPNSLAGWETIEGSAQATTAVLITF